MENKTAETRQDFNDAHRHCYAMIDAMAGARKKFSALASKLNAEDPAEAAALRGVFAANDELRSIENSILKIEIIVSSARLNIVLPNGEQGLSKSAADSI